MSRSITIPERTVIEDISGINYYPGQFVSFAVGIGTITEGKFNFSVPQNFESFELRDSLFNDLMTRYGQGFTEENLWYYVDLIRSGATNTAPGEEYDWYQPTQAWIPSINKLKKRKLNQIERRRDKVMFSPIMYNSASLDADLTALTNINGKLEEIAAAKVLDLSISSPLIWRDADNVTHTFSTVPEYKQWLCGLVMAIAARSTAAYVNSWTHKNNVLAFFAADDFEGLLAYDVTTGWPE